MQVIGNVLFALGVLSIPGSWIVFPGFAREFGLFIELWAPTLLLLSTRCELLYQLMTLRFTSMGSDFGVGGQWSARSADRRRSRREVNDQLHGAPPSVGSDQDRIKAQLDAVSEQISAAYGSQDTVDLPAGRSAAHTQGTDTSPHRADAR